MVFLIVTGETDKQRSKWFGKLKKLQEGGNGTGEKIFGIFFNESLWIANEANEQEIKTEI